MKVLVDTDILSEMQRARNEVLCRRAARHELHHGPIAISALTVFEGLQGWLRRGMSDRAERYLQWIADVEVLDFDLGCARLAGEIGGALVRAGRPIGVVDVGLAATAIQHGRVLVSGNTAHFGYVQEAGFDLKLENWRDESG